MIRVTIPVEKEIVNLTLSRRDADEAFRLINEVIKLGKRPGAGFCYWYPLDCGILDTRIWMGHQPYVASIEQVITALDVITGDTAWRRKTGETVPAKECSLSLASYAIYGPEGETNTAVRAALAAGAGGATQMLIRHEHFRDSERISSAYELTELVIADAALKQVHDAVIHADLSTKNGYSEISAAENASGYKVSKNTRSQ